jgi:UDP-perosamine 4-acetyltransferase
VAETLRASGREIAAFLDADRALWGTEVEMIHVMGGDEKLSEFPISRFSFAVGVGGVKDTRSRRAVHEAVVTSGAVLPPVVAASAVIARSARLGDGAQALTRAVVHPGASVGAGTVVNTAAVVEHDCVLGAHIFVGPGAILCGNVKIGDGTFIGAGAVILPGINLGANVLVAAGAVVRADVPDGGKALGRGPAKERR